MSKLALPIVESVLKLYRALEARAAELSSDPEASESSRADASVAALDFLRLEREARLLTRDDFDDEEKEVTDQWRKRVQAQIDAAIAKAEEIEVPEEKSYLYSVLFNAILSLSSTKRDFLFEETLEAILGRLLDSDRELVVYPYALFLARRLAYLSVDGIEKTRMKIGMLCEEIEDQVEFEHVMGAMAFASSIGLERNDGVYGSDDRVKDLFSASLVDYTALDTEEGVCRYYIDTFAEFVDLIPDSALESFSRDAYEGLKALLQGVEQSLETGVRSKLGRPAPDEEDEEETLEEDELDELRELAAGLEIDNPRALQDGEFLRGFVARRGAYGCVEKALARAKDALATLDSEPEDASFARRRLVYTQDRATYEGELAAWLNFARATFPVAETEAVAKARMLARLACVEFLYGDEEQGKDRVREALAIAARVFDSRDAADVYSALVQAHLDAKKIKPARRIAESLYSALDKIDEPVMADHLKSESFPIFIRLFDDARLADALDSFDSPAIGRRWSANCSVVSAIKDYKSSEDAAALESDLDKIAEQTIEETEGEDPVIAATALRRLAEFVAERFEKLVKQADK